MKRPSTFVLHLLRSLAVVAFALAVGSAAAAQAQPAAQAGQAAAPPAAPAAPAAPSAQAAAAAPPLLIVTSVQVINGPERCNDAIVMRLSAAPDARQSVPAGCAWMQQPASAQPAQVLLGAGDFIVSVQADTYDAAMAYLRKGPHRLNVFLNGFDMSSDAEQLAVERLGTQVFMHYHLTQGPQSRAMWADLIRHAGLHRPTPLAVSFGWDGGNPNNLIAPNFIGSCAIAVTTTVHIYVALAVLSALLVFGLLCARRTDMLRNSIPTEIVSILPAALSLRQALQQPGLTPAAISTLLQNTSPNYTGPEKIGDPVARQAVYEVLSNPAMLAAPLPPAVTVYLALMSDRDPVRVLAQRMSFSLARVQLFCWFMFALLAGVFLWLIYSELPSLDNSMLTLLGISAGTSGLAWAIDKSTDTTGTLTQGLMFDLTTGPDNQHKVHRFQTVMVNMVLLAIGIGHIVYGIAYPVFDPSWLIFLGISGTTYIAGKQLNE